MSTSSCLARQLSGCCRWSWLWHVWFLTVLLTCFNFMSHQLLRNFGRAGEKPLVKINATITVSIGQVFVGLLRDRNLILKLQTEVCPAYQQYRTEEYLKTDDTRFSYNTDNCWQLTATSIEETKLSESVYDSCVFEFLVMLQSLKIGQQNVNSYVLFTIKTSRYSSNMKDTSI